MALNTASNAVGRLWVTAIQFFVTPYMVSKLGDERFGIWAFLLVVVGYFGVFDLGIGAALIKYVSEYYAAAEYELLNRTVNSAFTVMTVLVGSVCGVGLIFSEPFVHLFRIPASSYGEAHFAFCGALLILVGQASLAVFQSLLNGLQRMDLFNLVAVVTSVPNALGVILFLHWGYGLRGLVINNALMFVLSALLTVVFVYRACPQYRFRPFQVDRRALKHLLSFGVQMQATSIGALICWHGDKIMIAYFLNMALVTAYELGYRIATAARLLPTFLISAVMPAASEVHSKYDHSKVQRLFDLGSRYLALIAFPAMVFVIYDSPLVMAAWMKQSRPEGVWAARLLALGFLVNVLGGVGTSVARGMGRPDIEARSILPQLILNFGISIPLIMRIGFWGPLIATPFSTVVATMYVCYLLHDSLRIRLGSFLKQGLWVPALGSLFATSVTALWHLGLSWTVQAPRYMLVTHLLADALVFFGSYAAFVWKIERRQQNDWNLIKDGLELAASPLYPLLNKVSLLIRPRPG